MATASLEALVEVLCDRFPEDAEDLNEALTVLKKQRITTCERLGRLGDNQWQRLGLPLGIEALLKDEAGAALAAAAADPAPEAPPPAAPLAAAEPRGAPDSAREAPNGRGQERPAKRFPEASDREDEEDDGLDAEDDACDNDLAEDDDDGALPLEGSFEAEGLHRRGAGGRRTQALPQSSGRATSSSSSSRRPAVSENDVARWDAPEDLQKLWQQLLEDCLPPDKRMALQETWDATPSSHDRYMMFLEYTSYLRKEEVSEEEKAERRKQLEPLLQEMGLKGSDFEDGPDDSNNLIWWIFFSVLFFLAGVIYYVFANPDPVHDLQAL